MLHGQEFSQCLVAFPVQGEVSDEPLSTQVCLRSDIFVLQAKERGAYSQPEVTDRRWGLLLGLHALLKPFIT